MTDTLPPLPPGFELDEAPDSANRGAPATYPGAAQIIASATPPPPPGFELDPHPDDAPGADPSTYHASDNGLEIDIVGGTPQSQASANAANSSQFARMVSGDAPPPAKPSLFRMDSDYDRHAGTGFFTRLGASARDMFVGHESAAKYLAEKAGGRVDRGPNGSPVVVLPDGSRYYVNDPGLDATDVANVAGNVAASFTPAGWASDVAKARQIGLMGRMAIQAGTAAATDAALQGGATAATGDFEVDPSRVALAGAGGAGGEVVGTALSAGARAVGAATRSLTGAGQAEARALAEQAGIANPTREQLNQFSRVADQARVGADRNALLGEGRFGLKYTQGQRLADGVRKAEQLTREESLAATPYGENAFRQLSEGNRATVGRQLERIGENLGGRAGATDTELVGTAADVTRQQAEALDKAISAAYEEAGLKGRAAINSEAVTGLPDRLRAAVSDYGLDPELTPAAWRTLEQMTAAARGLESATPGARTAGVTVKALETQRRILNARINAAANATDRAALLTMKREFDGMIDDAFDQGLTSGDPGALEVMKRARGLRAEFGRRFEGKADTDRFIGQLLDGSKTPEELVNIAFGARGVSRPAAARYVTRLKEAAGNDPEVVGSLRAAHLLRMTQNARGETVDFGKLISNIEGTKHSNDSLVSALYSPQEWAEIQSLAKALDPLVAKGMRAKSSGTTERLMRAMLGSGSAVLRMVPLAGEGLSQGAQKLGAVRDILRTEAAINAPLRLNAQAAPIVPAVGAGMAADGN